MNSWLWYLTRSTGLVATALMIAALAWGFFFSARETGTRLRPAWWLDLHNGLGGLAMIFTGIHLLTAFADSDLGIRLVAVFIPGTATSRKAAVTWGVLGFYGLALTVFTSWPRRLRKRRTWRAIHLLSVPATVLACVHAYQIGSDAHTGAFQILLPVAAAAGVYPLVLRVTKILSAHSKESPRQA
jgi:DMSO/TMAO reductase YedYZ heme-binding membrane subunit